MSAIAGLLLLDGANLEDHRLTGLVSSTSHVCADTTGVWHEGPVGLLHFNLVTTPQAQAERQPLIDRETGLVVLLDGRLDNRPELLMKCGRAAGLADTCGDAQLLLELFKKYGQDLVQQLVGDYSLVIWQSRTRQLFCARSPVGWRPFLWYMNDTLFAFATEPRTLIEGLGLERRLNEGALGEFLSMRFTSQTETLWRGIYRLPPGAAMTIEQGKMRSWHWHGGPFPESSLSEEEASQRFRELFDQSLEACMRSSTDVAAHLSGGLDSSTVVCRSLELFRAGRLERPVYPLSARFPGEMHDESEWSEAVESHTGLTSMIVQPRPYVWDRARQWCATTLHLPLRPNVLSTIIGSCEQLQACGMRVLLTGEGGDDWLRGSHGHWPDLVREGKLRQVWQETFSPRADYARRLKYFVTEGVAPLVLSSQRERLLRPHLQFSYSPPPWLRSEWARKIGLCERWRSDVPPMQLDTFSQQQRSFRYTAARPHVNVDNVLCMAAGKGVELRHPFHDLRLTHYLMGVPGGMLLRNGERKYLLRQAMRGTLPEKVRTRQTKADLSPPFVDALEEFFRETSVEELQCVKQGWVDGAYITRAFETNRRWYRSDRSRKWPTEVLGPVWSAVATEIWLREALKV
jgi:asparagine synthase (glutamine-hydrolysing)